MGRLADLVVISGLSGAGKSSAMNVFEDAGYFCVDNLPVTLLPTLADLTLRAGSEIARAAVVVDVREGRMLEAFPRVYKQLQKKGQLNPVLIFLEASEASPADSRTSATTGSSRIMRRSGAASWARP